MTEAVIYMRVSSEGQRFTDGFDRQKAAMLAYAELKGITIVDEYQDVITGTSDLEDRPGLAACMERIENNGVKLVLVESADRLARDAMVFELTIREFKKFGAKVITASGVDLTEGGDDNPTGALIRGILALVSEFDKRVIVLKLRAARQRKKARGERSEGVAPFGEPLEERNTFRQIIELSTTGKTSDEIATVLNSTFPMNPTRSGVPWRGSTIRKILARARKSRKYANTDATL